MVRMENASLNRPGTNPGSIVGIKVGGIYALVGVGSIEGVAATRGPGVTVCVGGAGNAVTALLEAETVGGGEAWLLHAAKKEQSRRKMMALKQFFMVSDPFSVFPYDWVYKQL